MKKTIIVTAIAFCLAISTSNANSETNYENTDTIVLVSKVSPFCLAIAKGDFDTVKKLVELGTDVNKKSNGMTPVMYAAKFNRVDIMKLLINSGAKLQAKSDRGLTAKDYAVISNAKDAIIVIENSLKKNTRI